MCGEASTSLYGFIQNSSEHAQLSQVHGSLYYEVNPSSPAG